MRKKQQTTEHEDSPDHIILHHHTPAALLQAEKNLIHQMLGWAFWVIFLGYLFSVWVVCVHFILFIKLFLCSISLKFMQSNIRGVNH